MTNQSRPYSDTQLSQLTSAFHRGAAESAAALSRWLNAEMLAAIDEVDQCQMEAAMDLLGEGEGAVCATLMEMQGTLSGHMLLAFDDASGLALADLILRRPAGTSADWTALEISCVLETMNIAGSAYLNGIAADLSERSGGRVELIPSPPNFVCDFAGSLLQSAFVDSLSPAGHVVYAEIQFQLSGRPLQWTFLLIPDPGSMNTLAEILQGLSSRLPAAPEP